MYYNGGNSYLFLNSKEIHKFNRKNFEILPNPLCLGSMSKSFSAEYIKKTGLDGYVYDVSVDYWAVATNKVLDIRKYLMESNNII